MGDTLYISPPLAKIAEHTLKEPKRSLDLFGFFMREHKDLESILFLKQAKRIDKKLENQMAKFLKKRWGICKPKALEIINDWKKNREVKHDRD